MKTSSLLSLCTLLLLSSCNHYFYAPNKVNVPGLRNAGDMRVEGGIGGGVITQNVELQAAYALAPFLGIMVNGALNRDQGEHFLDSKHEPSTNSRFAEVGLGYFKELQTNPDWLFEIYGGVGVGNYSLYQLDQPTYVLNKTRYFVQPSMLYTLPSQKIELAIASRLSIADYTGNNIPFANSGNLNNELRALLRDSPKVFWEPSFRFSVGSPTTKFYVGITPSILLSRDFDTREFYNLNTGVRFTFNTKKTKKRND